METLAEAVMSYNKRKAFALEVEMRVKVGKLYASCGEREAANEAWMAAQHVAGSLTKQVLSVRLNTIVLFFFFFFFFAMLFDSR